MADSNPTMSVSSSMVESENYYNVGQYSQILFQYTQCVINTSAKLGSSWITFVLLDLSLAVGSWDNSW